MPIMERGYLLFGRARRRPAVSWTAGHGTNCHMDTQRKLFDDSQPAGSRPRKPKPPVEPRAPLWTSDKSRLIAEYIHHFLMVTKHGIYLDLFAGPQHVGDTENWSVRRVLERRTTGPAIRHYAVCDKKQGQVQRLQELGQNSSSFRVYAGDANDCVHRMLKDAPINPKTACFCLIDQRTFECHWATVEAIARYKSEGYKIEIFYFLAQRWIDRAWASTKLKGRLATWWGNNDYEQFRKLRSFNRADKLCERFCMELGYAYSKPFSIHEKKDGMRTMYYMIHATDHPEACNLMSRAYRQIRPESHANQLSFPW